MDLVSHTLTGIAVGTVSANFSKKGLKDRLILLLIGGFGGALPDLDAFSLWSKFDSTVGTLLNLSHSGKEIYFGKLWYSHHASFHSIFAPLLIILLFAILRERKNIKKAPYYLKDKWLYASSFFFGFFFHLLEDLPTPASVWGGVRLFFPSETYIGGYGKIWWWNNYDLVIIIFFVILINVSLLCIPRLKFIIRTRAALAAFTLGIVLYLIQINSRPIDFSYTGHTIQYQKMERQSKAIQKDLLGPTIYSWMEALDNKIPLYF